ncbi:twin-arginine translocation signal domain-containing protein [Nonomuraea sp. NPDC005983]
MPENPSSRRTFLGGLALGGAAAALHLFAVSAEKQG